MSRHEATRAESPATSVVRVLYFAALKDLLHTDEEQLPSPPEGSTVGTLLDDLVRRHPALAPALPQLRVAVNEVFVDLDHPIRGNDTIALLPPLGGG